MYSGSKARAVFKKDRRGFPLHQNKNEKAFQIKNAKKKTPAPPSFLCKEISGEAATTGRAAFAFCARPPVGAKRKTLMLL